MSSPLLLSQTSLHPKYQARCRRANIFNVHQLVAMPTAELAGLLGLDRAEAEEVLDTLVGRILPRCLRLGARGKRGRRRAREAEREKRMDTSRDDDSSRPDGPSLCGSTGYRISSGQEALDAALGGGIHTGMLTEIVGESSCGKSQLALQLAVHTALGSPERQAGSVALMISEGNTQGSLAVRRMLEMAEHIARRRWRIARGTAAFVSPLEYSTKRQRLQGTSHPSSSPSQGEEAAVETAKQQVLMNVYLASIRDLDALEHVIEYTLPGLAHRLLEQNNLLSVAPSSQARPATPLPPLRLVIVDNLPCLFYATHPTSMNAMVARSRALGSLSDGLKRIARIGSPLGVKSARGNPVVKREFAEANKGWGQPQGPWANGLDDESERLPVGGMPLAASPFTFSATQTSPTSTSTEGGSAIVIINHVSDVFNRDLRALGEIASYSESFSSSAADTTGVVHPGGTFSQLWGLSGEAPLAYCHQSPLFSGLTTSLRAASFLSRLDFQGREDACEERGIGIFHDLSEKPHPSSLFGIIDPVRFAPTLDRLSPSSFSAVGKTQIEADPLGNGAFSGAKQAALGHVWNNCINVRIMLCKTGRRVCNSHTIDDIEPNVQLEEATDNATTTNTTNSNSASFHSKLRGSLALFTATLIFSPYAPQRETFFTLGAAGVQSLSLPQVKEGLLPVGYAREEEWVDDDENQGEEKHQRREEAQDKSARGDAQQISPPPAVNETSLHVQGKIESSVSGDIDGAGNDDEDSGAYAGTGMEELEAIMGEFENGDGGGQGS